MTDEQPILPEDSIEDLTPGEEGEQVSGGAVDAFLKIDDSASPGQSIKSGLKI
jgi:hypothetical protein